MENGKKTYEDPPGDFEIDWDKEGGYPERIWDTAGACKFTIEQFYENFFKMLADRKERKEALEKKIKGKSEKKKRKI